MSGDGGCAEWRMRCEACHRSAVAAIGSSALCCDCAVERVWGRAAQPTLRLVWDADAAPNATR